MSLQSLRKLREFGPQRRTIGLSDAVIERFAAEDASLRLAIDEAVARHEALREDYSDLLKLGESAQIEAIQKDFVNFYPADAVNPYVALAARGAVDRHVEGCGDSRLGWLRHARSGSRARPGSRGDGCPARHGQHHDGRLQPAPLYPPAQTRDRSQPR